jgi:hypothetical protein
MNGHIKKNKDFGKVYDKINNILEAFKDIGKLSQKELMKGQYLNPHDKDNFKQVTGRVFYKAISKIKENDIAKLNKGLPSKGLKTLTVYNASDYNKMKCFLGKNNSSGYCIAHGNELVSVFSSQKSSGDAIMIDAIKNGAKRLDCFAFRKNNKISGPLYKLYSKYGFKIDKSMNSGNPGESYAIINGISDYVNDNDEVEPDNPQVVIFMKK